MVVCLLFVVCCLVIFFGVCVLFVCLLCSLFFVVCYGLFVVGCRVLVVIFLVRGCWLLVVGGCCCCCCCYIVRLFHTHDLTGEAQEKEEICGCCPCGGSGKNGCVG